MLSNTGFLDAIREVGSPQTLSAGIQLFRQGDPIRDIYLLEKGLVKFIRTEMNGREMITEIRSGRSLLGVTSVFASQPAPTTLITLVSCEVYRVPVKEFLYLEKMNSAFTHTLLERISCQRNEQTVRHSQISLISARTRLEQLLAQFMDEFGVKRNGQLHLCLPISKGDIAGLLAVTPQRLSVILAEMKEDGLLLEGKGWLIFSGRLSGIACN